MAGLSPGLNSGQLEAGTAAHALGQDAGLDPLTIDRPGSRMTQVPEQSHPQGLQKMRALDDEWNRTPMNADEKEIIEILKRSPQTFLSMREISKRLGRGRLFDVAVSHRPKPL